jgi:hypothetical protein
MKNIAFYQQWYAKIKNKYNELEYLDFVRKLSKTPYIEYHYSIIMDDETDYDFRELLWGRFGRHKDAENFLADRLEHNFDSDYHGEILFYLGNIIYQNPGPHQEKVHEFAVKSADSANESTRAGAINFLSDLGSRQDFPFLKGRLLEDPSPQIRSSAAAAIMRLGLREKSQALTGQILACYYLAVQKEGDLLVIEAILAAVQEITHKKFSLTGNSSNENFKEKITFAKNNLIKYLYKHYIVDI